MSYDSIPVIKLSGEYDIYKASELEAALAPTLDAPHAVVDFADVRYVDSTALSVFVRLRKRRAERGFEPKRFIHMNPSLRWIFSITNLDTIWPPYDDLASALASFEM